jgi:hypothetical protein
MYRADTSKGDLQQTGTPDATAASAALVTHPIGFLHPTRSPITVLGSFPQSRFMPCPECGASVARVEAETHECDVERLLDFRLFQLREEIAAFDAQLTAWLASARGRFAAWLAERDRRARGSPGPLA